MSLVSELALPWSRFAGELHLLRGWRLGLFLLAFAVAYFLAAKLGIATSLPPEGIVTVWPPNAVVLAALVSIRRERWWLLFLATVGAEIAADLPDYPLWAAAGYGIVNFSEAALAAILLTKFSNGGRLVELRDFTRFLVIGPLIASGTAALFGAAIYKIGAPEIDYFHYWRVFWLGDALGLLTLGTALLAWRRPTTAPGLSGRFAVPESALLSLGLVAVASWAFLADSDTPRVYLTFPFLVWAALRFGVRGVSLAIIAMTAITVASAVMGYGPFSGLSNINAVMALQGLVAIAAISTFMLAFSAEASWRKTIELERSLAAQQNAEAELRAAYRALEKINKDLDATVAERTRDLRRTIARNEMLFKELHHRVKNNLQLVSSLVALQSRKVSSPATRRKFAEVQTQISAIAATYNVLQQMQIAEVVDFSQIVPVLCRNIEDANGELVSITCTASGDSVVSADAAVALSLALNELITNSIKHAAAGEVCVIELTCTRQGDVVVLRVSDNGPGFPAGFDVNRTKGFGMRMARSIVGQAGGQMRAEASASGALVEIVVPVAIKSEEAE